MAKQKNLDLEDVEPKKERAVRRKKDETLLGNLKDETLQGVMAVLCFLVSIFLLLAAFDKAGVAGAFTYKWLEWSFGIGYYLVPLITAVLGISYLRNLRQKFDALKLLGALLFLLSSLSILHILYSINTVGNVVVTIDGQAPIVPTLVGGYVGKWVSYPLVSLLDNTASLVFLFAFLVISFLITFNSEIDISRLAFWKKPAKRSKKEELDEEENAFVDSAVKNVEAEVKAPDEKKITDKEEDKKENKIKLALGALKFDDNFIKPKTVWTSKEYQAPPLSLLELDRGKPGVGDIKGNMNTIKRMLANFGIDVEMDEVSIGPSVTRYALKPAEGVKLAKIVTLQDNLALALAAQSIRIEAPIPGKSLVGIEVPNTIKTTVGLGTMLGSEEFKGSDKPLLVSLGKGISGKAHFANVAKMPHALIAGSTGSGKSVTIHALIVSLLYRNSPNDLKFIMIDPKRVELTLYNKIPHLLTPVITDAKKAILALKWAAKEMDRRYDILQSKGVRDIDSYHKNIVNKEKVKPVKDGAEEVATTTDPMPYIVIVIDELADIMSTYPRELEAGIVRLAQMSRAVGIHLMLSTQRPSVNVITGLIKANVPARIALQVSSQVDSRTILDMSGAEKLLGAGDMLFMSGEMSKPQRIQSAYISESEVKRVVKHLIDTHTEELEDKINLTDTAVAGKNSIFESSFEDESMNGEDDDELYEQARTIVMEAGKASTSYIQRKLRVGYARAARLMDILEERGVIGPGDGAKPRTVIGGDGAAVKEEPPTDEII